MTWINAELVLRQLQRQDEDRAYRRELRRQEEIRRTLDAIRRGIIYREEQAEKWSQVYAEQVADWEYEQYRRWEERR